VFRSKPARSLALAGFALAEELFRHKEARNPLYGAGFHQTINTFAKRLGFVRAFAFEFWI
jgi:hypothetical protein